MEGKKKMTKNDLKLLLVIAVIIAIIIGYVLGKYIIK